MGRLTIFDEETDNKYLVRLELFRRKNGLSYRKLAKLFELDVSVVWKYCYEDRFPTRKTAERIEEKTNGFVKLKHWGFKDERKLRVKANDVLFAWNCMAQLVSSGELEQDESVFLIQVMVDLGEQHRKSTRSYNLKLEVDKFRAIWHSINMCIEKEIIPESKKDQGWNLIARVAELLDIEETFNTSATVLLESKE